MRRRRGEEGVRVGMRGGEEAGGRGGKEAEGGGGERNYVVVWYN